MITINLALFIVILLVVVALGYTTINVLLKIEKMEDIVDKQQTFIDNLRSDIEEADNHLEEIDQKGQFKSDDEIGWFFDEIKEIKSRLEIYKPQ
jgi:hypothetical protein